MPNAVRLLSLSEHPLTMVDSCSREHPATRLTGTIGRADGPLPQHDDDRDDRVQGYLARLGTVTMMAMMPTASMNTLNISAIEAANRTLIFSVLPIATSANRPNPSV